VNKNNSIPEEMTTENKDTLTLPENTETAEKRPPLVLPEEDFPVRKRPAVNLETVEVHPSQQRSRPAVNPEEIHKTEERIVHDGRITGEKHSDTSSAAPVRTRTPEENRGVTNGIPTRRTSVKENEEAAAPQKSRSAQTLLALVIAAVGVILMLTAVVVAVNRVYLPDSERPADFLESVPQGEVTDIRDAAAAVPDRNLPSDETESTAEETDPTETDEGTDPDTAEGESDHAESPDTEAPETKPYETEPAETQPPEPERYTVTLRFYNREPITVTTEAIRISDLLEIVGYEPKDTDRMSVDLSAIIQADTEIQVDTVEFLTIEEYISIPFDTQVNELQTIPRGQQNLIQKGEEGLKTLSYSLECVNGQEISRTLVSETVTKNPVTEIYDLGVGGVLTGSDGNTYSYSYYRVVPATYYNIEGLTWVGTMASENTIATNFDYIPLGTRLYVKNDKFDFGVRTVEDTGTMKGYEVDIWLSDSNPQKEAFAYIGYHHDMVIYYLD